MSKNLCEVGVTNCVAIAEAVCDQCGRHVCEGCSAEIKSATHDRRCMLCVEAAGGPAELLYALLAAEFDGVCICGEPRPCAHVDLEVA